MKAAELRQSILQAAVQGKLVPQNSKDEPASELLNRIQRKKAKLVRDGKIKKEKPLPEIADYEIPFEIPGTWKWCRLLDLCKSITDGDHQPPPQVASGIPFLVISNISLGKLDFSNTRYVSEDYFKNLQQERIAEIGDILFSVTGSYGIPILVGTTKQFCFQRHIALFKPLVEKEYLYHLLSSPIVKNQCDKAATGTAQKTVGLKSLKSIVVPLPPLAEQCRIVTKIEKLLALCDELEAEEKKLDALEAHFTEYLPKSILQEAVRGKLVPQNAHDEPASELLKRVQKEKAQLIKDGKIKKEKPLPSISEDEIPYDLPEGWVWCRLGEISDLRIGKTPARADERYWNNGKYPWVSIADMENGKWIYNTKECVSSEAYNIVFKQNLVSAGSLLFSFKLTIGKVSILGMDAFTNEAICAITPIGEKYIATYLFNVLPALDLLSGANSAVKGKTLNSKSLSNIITPLPPLEEQYRIVAKIEELFALCNEMKAAYTEPVEFDKVAEIIPFPIPATIEQTEESAEPLLLAARGDAEDSSQDIHNFALKLLSED